MVAQAESPRNSAPLVGDPLAATIGHRSRTLAVRARNVAGIVAHEACRTALDAVIHQDRAGLTLAGDTLTLALCLRELADRLARSDCEQAA